jgi:hypothetical protein
VSLVKSAQVVSSDTPQNEYIREGCTLTRENDHCRVVIIIIIVRARVYASRMVRMYAVEFNGYVPGDIDPSYSYYFGDVMNSTNRSCLTIERIGTSRTTCRDIIQNRFHDHTIHVFARYGLKTPAIRRRDRSNGFDENV